MLESPSTITPVDIAIARGLVALNSACKKHKTNTRVKGRAAELMQRFIKVMYERLESEGTPLYVEATGRGAALACLLTAYRLEGTLMPIIFISKDEREGVIRSIRKFYFTALPNVLGKAEVRPVCTEGASPNHDPVAKTVESTHDLLKRFIDSRKMHVDVTATIVAEAAYKLEAALRTYEKEHAFTPTLTAAAILYWCCQRLRTGNDPEYTLDVLCKEWNIPKKSQIMHTLRALDPVFRRAYANWERYGVMDPLPERERADVIHNAIMNEKIASITENPKMKTHWKSIWDTLLTEDA